MQIPLEFIEKKMIEIRDEYDALPEKPVPPKSLIRFLALADTIKENNVKPITLDDVDRMALETLTMTGEITIREDTPPSPSVGWPGSDTVEGEITGRFEVPEAGVIIYIGNDCEPDIRTDDADRTPISDYIREGALMDKIGEYDGITYHGGNKPTVDIEITGVTKKGDRAVVEFKVIVK